MTARAKPKTSKPKAPKPKAPHPKARSAQARGDVGPRKTSKWSKKVMEKSDAMDLRPGVFKLESARAIAGSLKRSSEASHRRKASPFRSAMSMLNFEINRAGKNLSPQRVRVLNQAKVELRKVFGRPPSNRS
jgi:hypothetical protein